MRGNYQHTEPPAPFPRVRRPPTSNVYKILFLRFGGTAENQTKSRVGPQFCETPDETDVIVDGAGQRWNGVP